MKRDRHTAPQAKVLAHAIAAHAIAPIAIACVALGAGCSSAPPPPPRPVKTAAIPVKTSAPEPPRAPEREPPPASAPAGDLRIPTATWAELPNGLKMAAAPSRALPLVEIRVVVLGGTAAEGERTGVASLTAELLRTGGAGATPARDEAARIEALGGDLSARADFDRITLRLAVTKGLLGEAFDLLGDAIARPQLSPTAFTKVKKRAVDRAADRAQNDADWATSMVLFRDLFALPADRHPYASFDATADELSKITAMDCRAYWARHFVPKNTFVVVAGDVALDDVKAAVTKAFGGFAGAEPPVTSFTDPVAPEAMKITLVDRPKSAESTIAVGTLGPARSDEDWAAFTVAAELAGRSGGPVDVSLREGQVATAAVTSSIVELAGSPAVFSSRARTAAPQAGLALKGMLDRIAALGTEAQPDAAIDAAKTSLTDALAIRFASLGDVADSVANLRALRLWDDALPVYRKALRDVTPVLVGKAASENLRTGHAVVVVTGDAELIGPTLSHFAEVKVVDPTKGFQRVRSIPMNADAPLKPPRVESESP